MTFYLLQCQAWLGLADSLFKQGHCYLTYLSSESKTGSSINHKTDEADFKKDYQAWKEKWKDAIGHKSLHKDGKMHYTHQRLRAAMNSLNFYLPYLFTNQREDCKGMPNTNNKFEGTFTDLKKNLNNHSGLTQENRKRSSLGFSWH